MSMQEKPKRSLGDLGLACCLISLGCAAALAGAEAPAPVASAPAAGGVPIRYGLPREAVVTLNITRPDGWVVRELIVAEKRPAGQHEVLWDGRDNHGRPLPAGDYQWRMIQHDGLGWQYVTSIGNSGTPPWRTADGTGGWGGNHGQPLAVAVDETGVYLGWTSTEGPYSILKRTHDGDKGVWGMTMGPFEGVLALAADGKNLYGANNKRLIKVDRASGKQLATVNLAPGKPAAAGTLVVPPDSVAFSFTQGDGGGRVWGLAAAGSRVYLSNARADRIEVYDADKLQPCPDEDIPLPRPRGLAADGAGGLLVVSQGKVLAVDLKNKAGKPVVAGDLEAPFAVARAADGTLYVTDLGKAQQVKKFSPAGKLLAAFGAAGGGVGSKRGGVYEPQNFLQPTALAVNPDGSLWVVEDMIPKRIARISPEGKLLWQGFGSVNYGAKTSPNPADPAEVFSMMWGAFSARVDYDRKTWQIHRILRPQWKGESYGFDAGFEPDKIIVRGGRSYLWAGPWPGKTGFGLQLIEADHLRTVLYCRGGVPDGPLAELAKQRGAAKDGWNVVWTDRNDDQVVQPEEIAFVKQHLGGIADDDFALLGDGLVWKPKGFTSGGAPLYDPADIQANPQATSFRDSKGNFYRMVEAADDCFPPGEGFWSARNSVNYVLSEGPTRRWAIGRKAVRTAAPGEMYYLWRLDGEMGDCIFVTDMEGIVHVIHRDGFYVQSLLQDPRHGRQAGPDLLNVENFSGTVMEHPHTHKQYLYISSAEASHIFEITGLRSIRPAGPPQAIRLETPAMSPLSQAAARSGEYIIKRLPPGARVADFGWRKGIVPIVGGDWDRNAPAMPIYRDGKLAAEVRAYHDGQKLYVVAHVLSDRPFEGRIPIDKLGDLPACGDALVLMLGCDASAPADRKEPVRGDMCFVITEMNQRGPGVALLQPVADTFAPEAARPLRLGGAGGSPITAIGHATWTGGAVRIRRSVHQTGYDVLAAIPLDQREMQTLWRPPRSASAGELIDTMLGGGTGLGQGTAKKPGALRTDLGGVRIRFDAAVVWGQGGKGPEAAVCWHSRSPGGAADVHPDSWGWAVFEGQPPAKDNILTAARAARPMRIDGAGDDWGDMKPTPIAGPEGPVAQVRLAYDATCLYALVEVKDPTPLRNAASAAEMILKGGDAVGLCLAGEGAAAAPQKFLAAKVKGQDAPVLVTYRPRSAVKRPYTFASPVSKLTLDYVGPVPQEEGKAQVAVRQSPDGYAVEFALPWKAITAEPRAGLKLPFDVQVILSDPAGSINATSAWWHSRGPEPACTLDLPTEAQLYPKLWGTMQLE